MTRNADGEFVLLIPNCDVVVCVVRQAALLLNGLAYRGWQGGATKALLNLQEMGQIFTCLWGRAS